MAPGWSINGNAASRPIRSSGAHVTVDITAKGVRIRLRNGSLMKGPIRQSRTVGEQILERDRRSAGSVSPRGPSEERSTRMFRNSGAQRAIGSVRANRPSSSSMSAAVEVTGLVIEAMRNRLSCSMGSPTSLSRDPTHARWTISPSRQTIVAAPASAPAITSASRAAAIGRVSFVLRQSMSSRHDDRAV